MHYLPSVPSMKKVFGWLLLASVLLLPGCSSVEYNSTNSPRMVVSSDRTPFFHNGPAQGNGPDLSLIKGDVVEVLRKEIGYSFVRIEDGRNGYVANEALSPAPASVAPPVKKKTTPSPKAKKSAANQAGSPPFRY